MWKDTGHNYYSYIHPLFHSSLKNMNYLFLFRWHFSTKVWRVSRFETVIFLPFNLAMKCYLSMFTYIDCNLTTHPYLLWWLRCTQNSYLKCSTYCDKYINISQVKSISSRISVYDCEVKPARFATISIGGLFSRVSVERY